MLAMSAIKMIVNSDVTFLLNFNYSFAQFLFVFLLLNTNYKYREVERYSSNYFCKTVRIWAEI